jgi:hypothetical protein
MNYPDLMSVLKKSVISDGQGGQVETFATSIGLSEIECYFRQLSAEEIIISQKRSKSVTARIYCGHENSDIQISDIISLIKSNDSISELFEINAVDQRRIIGSGDSSHIQIDVYAKD